MITVDHDSPVAAVRAGARADPGAGRSGELDAGTKLPTVRGLAGDLGLAANTVARAYRELEALGVIETRGRAGSVVTGSGVEQAARRPPTSTPSGCERSGIDRDEALDLVRRAFD